MRYTLVVNRKTLICALFLIISVIVVLVSITNFPSHINDYDKNGNSGITRREVKHVATERYVPSERESKDPSGNNPESQNGNLLNIDARKFKRVKEEFILLFKNWEQKNVKYFPQRNQKTGLVDNSTLYAQLPKYDDAIMSSLTEKALENLSISPQSIKLKEFDDMRTALVETIGRPQTFRLIGLKLQQEGNVQDKLYTADYANESDVVYDPSTGRLKFSAQMFSSSRLSIELEEYYKHIFKIAEN
jgi:hypothetical protein